MKNKLHLIILAIGFALLFIGIYYTLNNWWKTNIDISSIDFIVSFYCYCISSLFLASTLTYLILVPKNFPFKIQMLSSKYLFNTLKSNIEIKKAKRISIVSTLLFPSLAILFIFALPCAFNAYEKYQLLNYGETQKVEISKIGYSQKGLPIATITYQSNGITYTKELFLKNHKEGEKVLVRFSTKKPLMAAWNDEFYK